MKENSGMFIGDGDSARDTVMAIIKRRCEQDETMRDALDFMLASVIVELMLYKNDKEELKAMADRFCPIIKAALGIDLTGV